MDRHRRVPAPGVDTPAERHRGRGGPPPLDPGFRDGARGSGRAAGLVPLSVVGRQCVGTHRAPRDGDGRRPVAPVARRSPGSMPAPRATGDGRGGRRGRGRRGGSRVGGESGTAGGGRGGGAAGGLEESPHVRGLGGRRGPTSEARFGPRPSLGPQGPRRWPPPLPFAFAPRRASARSWNLLDARTPPAGAAAIETPAARRRTPGPR